MKVLHKTKCYFFFAVTAKKMEREAEQIQIHV